MGIWKIYNDELRLSVSTKGAEPRSITDVKTGEELLWQGDPKIWADRAPLLFPLIGRLKNKKYTVNGAEYNINSHGFAADMDFAASVHRDDYIELVLTENEEALPQYPFSFHLTVSFELRGREIIKRHEIKNTSDEKMYYEIGGHEGYRLDFSQTETMEDYELYFEGTDTLELITADENIMMNEQRESIVLNNGVMPLSMDMFKNDALIFDDVKGRRVELRHKNGKKIAGAEFDDFRFLGIWTRYLPGVCKYLCIEPWTSLPDGNFLGYELEKKLGVRVLEPQACETLTYTITL